MFAEDVARAYVRAASAPGIEGHTFDIGSGALTSVREIVRLIVDFVGPPAREPVFGAVPVRPREQEVDIDVEETQRLLGWRATTSLEEGLRRTVASYRKV